MAAYYKLFAIGLGGAENRDFVAWVEPYLYESGEDYGTTESDDYLCRVIYDLPSVSSSTGLDFDDGGAIYMGFSVNTASSSPTYEGDCDGVASAFGVERMSDWVDDGDWGYGFGPMTSSWEDELAEALGDDWEELGDTAGASYLQWASGDGTEFTTWGYFQVYGFSDDGIMIDFDEEPIAGVRDSTTPADGYYYNNAVYVLTFGS